MNHLIHAGPAYELVASITPNRLGHTLEIHSFWPLAQRPRSQRLVQVTLPAWELRLLAKAIDEYLEETK